MATNTQTIPEVDTELRDLAASVVSRAMKAGATAAEAVVRESSEFSTVVRMGEVETLKESGSRGHWAADVSWTAHGEHVFQRLLKRWNPEADQRCD